MARSSEGHLKVTARSNQYKTGEKNLMAGPLSRRLCPSTSRTIHLFTCGPKSRRYEVIALTNLGFRDLVTPELGSLNVELDLQIWRHAHEEKK